jgi:hypothetical protein
MGALRTRTSLLLAGAALCGGLAACGDDPITGTTPSGGASLPRGTGTADSTGTRTLDTPSRPAPAEVRVAVERTLGSWFRLVQYRAVQQALGLYTNELAGRLRGTEFEDDLFTYFGPYVATKRLAVDEVRAAEGDPDRVTAFARLLPKDVPDGQPRPADELFLVALRRQGDVWRLADTTFVRNQADSIRRAVARDG